jgi:hypothetical protein
MRLPYVLSNCILVRLGGSVGEWWARFTSVNGLSCTSEVVGVKGVRYVWYELCDIWVGGGRTPSFLATLHSLVNDLQVGPLSGTVTNHNSECPRADVWLAIKGKAIVVSRRLGNTSRRIQLWMNRTVPSPSICSPRTTKPSPRSSPWYSSPT